MAQYLLRFSAFMLPLGHVCAELRLHLQHGFDVDPTLSPILWNSLLSPDQPEAIALDLCKSVQNIHGLGNTVIHRKMVV